MIPAPPMLFGSGNDLLLGNYDIAPHGQHFLMVQEKEAPASSKELSVGTRLGWRTEADRSLAEKVKSGFLAFDRPAQ